MPTCAPTDRCCCSHCNIQGSCFWCFGPPIWQAARGICIYYIVFGALNLVRSIVAIANNDPCSQTQARNLEYAVLVIGLLVIIAFSIGIYLAGTRSAANAKVLLIMHCFMMILLIGVNFCSSGNFSKSLREKDALLNAACAFDCNFKCGGSCGSTLFGDRCQPNNNPAAGIVGLIIEGAVASYFGFVLWSHMVKCGNGTADHANVVAFVQAAPAAMAANVPVAVALPVQQQATGTAVAEAAAVPQASAVPVAAAAVVNEAPQQGAQQMYPKAEI